MAARTLQIMLCMSLAALLATPYCNAARRLRLTDPVTRGLLSSTSVLEDDPEVPTNDIDEEVPIPASEKDAESNQWARFQAEEVTVDDYNPPEANPDPGNPSPGIGD